MGVPLFDRSGHGIALNENGRAFYPHAEAIIRELAEGSQQMREMRDQNLGRVSISTCAARQINQLMVRHMRTVRTICSVSGGSRIWKRSEGFWDQAYWTSFDFYASRVRCR